MRRMCERCRIAIAKPTGRWCQPCYDTGEAARPAAQSVARHISALRASGMTLADIAGLSGCTVRTLIHIEQGRTVTTRTPIAEAVLAVAPIPAASGCQMCDDMEVVLMSTTDPQAAASRVGSTAQALQRHAYRCGRPDLGRAFGHSGVMA